MNRRAQREQNLEYVTTADGARITCKRKPGDGVPIIFTHGIAVNADLWDIPPIDTGRFRFRCLSDVLHALGFDIWMMNLRGHGAPHMYSAPPPGQRDWMVDHFIGYDLPAVVDHVFGQRHQRPWLLGNSLGAMTIAGFLQGAEICGESRQQHVVADEGLARCRQDKVRGAVLIEFPAALRWPDSLYDEQGWLRWRELWSARSRTDGDVNYPFEMMARSNLLQTLIKLGGQIPLRWLRSDPAAGAWRKGAPKAAQDALAWADDLVMEATRRAVAAFKGGEYFEPEMFQYGFRPAVDDIKAGVINQLAKCVRRRAFVSALGHSEYVYSDHYDRIACPILLVLGGKDRIANAEVAREVFFDSISSADKSLELFPDLAHGEFEWAPIACQKVYPVIRDWIASRTPPADNGD